MHYREMGSTFEVTRSASLRGYQLTCEYVLFGQINSVNTFLALLSPEYTSWRQEKFRLLELSRVERQRKKESESERK